MRVVCSSKSRWSGVLFALLVVVTQPVFAWSQDRLADHLREALARSAELQKQQSRIRSANAKIKALQAENLPKVSLDIAAGFHTGEVNGYFGSTGRGVNGGYAEFRLSFSHLLLDGGERRHSIAAAGYSRDALTKEALFHEDDVLHKTFLEWIETDHAARLVELTAVSADFAKRQVEIEEARFAEGLATITELSVTRAHHETTKSTHLHAQQAHLKVANGLDRELPQDTIEAGSLRALCNALPEKRDKDTQLLATAHPLLGASAHRMEEMASRVEKARSKSKPKLYLEGHAAIGRTPPSPYENSTAIGIRLTIPLVAASSRDAAVSEALEAQYRKQLEHDEMRAAMERQIDTLSRIVRLGKLDVERTGKAMEEAASALVYAVEERDLDLTSTPQVISFHKNAIATARLHFDAWRLHLSSCVEALSATGRLKGLINEPKAQFSHHVAIPLKRPAARAVILKAAIPTANPFR